MSELAARAQIRVECDENRLHARRTRGAQTAADADQKRQEASVRRGVRNIYTIYKASKLSTVVPAALKRHEAGVRQGAYNIALLGKNKK